MPDTVSIQKIKEVIGEEAVQKMIDEFAGRQLYIPKKGIEFFNQEEKEEYIKNLYYSAGKAICDIAPLVGLSSDRVRKIIYSR